MNPKLKYGLIAGVVVLLVLPQVAKKLQLGSFNPKNSPDRYEDRLSLPFKSCRIDLTVSSLGWTRETGQRKAELLQMLTQRLELGGVTLQEGSENVLKVDYKEAYSTLFFPGLPSTPKDCPSGPLAITMTLEAIAGGKQVYTDAVSAEPASYHITKELEPGEFLCDKVRNQLRSSVYSSFDASVRERKLFEK